MLRICPQENLTGVDLSRPYCGHLEGDGSADSAKIDKAGLEDGSVLIYMNRESL